MNTISIINSIKSVLKKLPIAFTKNQRYDRNTIKILKNYLKIDSNTVDIGCHKGEVLDEILKFAPKGKHYGFEPLPDFYKALLRKYKEQDNIQIHDYALSDSAGKSVFNYVISKPAYSGLIKRNYDSPFEVDSEIEVRTARLDEVLDPSVKIDFIKIDVEGGELGVLKGARNTIINSKPIIVFEHGMGAADCYGTKPSDIYELLVGDYGMKISTMNRLLGGNNHFDKKTFEKHFYERIDYYFIAYY